MREIIFPSFIVNRVAKAFEACHMNFESYRAAVVDGTGLCTVEPDNL